MADSSNRLDERSGPGDVTRLLVSASHGDKAAFDRLFPLVYDELKVLARGKLRMERASHTLNATALVHEAYLRLVDQDEVEWQSRSHFFAVSARAMRRILISYARMKKRQKRGGGAEHVSLDASREEPGIPFDDDHATELLALDEALERLEELSVQAAEVVQYRFFGGLTHVEIAEVLGTSEATVRRRWRMAKTWLRRELSPDAVSRTQTLLVGG